MAHASGSDQLARAPAAANDRSVPYRSERDAQQARIEELEQELRAKEAELERLKAQYGRAMEVLRMIAETRRIGIALEALREAETEEQ